MITIDISRDTGQVVTAAQGEAEDREFMKLIAALVWPKNTDGGMKDDYKKQHTA